LARVPLADAYAQWVISLLGVLGIPTSTYYGWRARRTSTSPRRCGDERLLALIEEILVEIINCQVREGSDLPRSGSPWSGSLRIYRRGWVPRDTSERGQESLG
ncbi:hypothetical protein R3Q06_36145, partial [Rhodococcus erythropolis]|uniref:hypothetical protein n=1 Tax=Rhodococcus erythropolis TaxID=1833 RepID=UPI002948E15A